MVTVNTGGLSESVFESELFGHVRGAFTDAKADRAGRFELADGGILFLDEIANISLAQQTKLLRVLETGEFERVGSSRTRAVDVRVFSATNADLRARSDGGALPSGSALPLEHGRDPAAAAPRPGSRTSPSSPSTSSPSMRGATGRLSPASTRGRSRLSSPTPGRATCGSSTTPSSAGC